MPPIIYNVTAFINIYLVPIYLPFWYNLVKLQEKPLRFHKNLATWKFSKLWNKDLRFSKFSSAEDLSWRDVHQGRLLWKIYLLKESHFSSGYHWQLNIWNNQSVHRASKLSRVLLKQSSAVRRSVSLSTFCHQRKYWQEVSHLF